MKNTSARFARPSRARETPLRALSGCIAATGVLAQVVISLAKVDHPRVATVRLADGPSQAIGRLRDRDQVNVIGHEAAGPHCDLVNTAPLPHELQVAAVILIAKERLLPAVSPLGDVMW